MLYLVEPISACWNVSDISLVISDSGAACCSRGPMLVFLASCEVLHSGPGRFAQLCVCGSLAFVVLLRLSTCSARGLRCG